MLEKIKEITAKIAEEKNILIDEIVVDSNINNIRIIVDKIDGITLEELTEFSRTLSKSEIFENIIGEKYRYEVTSPGTYSKMTKPYQFIRNLNRDVKIFVKGKDIKRPIIGKIIKADDEKILIEKNNKQKNMIELNYQEINYAKLKLKW